MSPQGDQVPIVGGGNDFSVDPADLHNKVIREDLLSLARIVNTQVNLSMEPRVNVVERGTTGNGYRVPRFSLIVVNKDTR